VIALRAEGWAGVLQHERVPLISYPFEWPSGMLRDAALLQLRLLLTALEEGFVLKDGTAYNVQWRGIHPVFIDVASFERQRPGRPWAGYRQFCQTCLFPLMLQVYKQIPFQPWLRGRLDGITPQELRRTLRWRDLFRRGIPTHVCLHAWLESRTSLEKVNSSKQLKAPGFHDELIRTNVRNMIRLVERLKWKTPQSLWSGYGADNQYLEEDQQQKIEFVRKAVHSRRWKQVWDLGCNTGNYSRIAAENADFVVAMDFDPASVEVCYQSLKQQPVGDGTRILPLVSDLADGIGGLGWRGQERKPLTARGQPDLILCLALLHHLVIGRGIPLAELLGWFAELQASLVLEYVSKSDPMVHHLLRGRRDDYRDYDPDNFLNELQRHFQIERSETIAQGNRTLYFVTPR